jgi:hypothetical protein
LILQVKTKVGTEDLDGRRGINGKNRKIKSGLRQKCLIPFFRKKSKMKITFSTTQYFFGHLPF